MNLLASLAVFFALLQAPPSVPATFTGVYRGLESGRVVIVAAVYDLATGVVTFEPQGAAGEGGAGVERA